MILDLNVWNSPVRTISAKVELSDSSTKIAEFTDKDVLKSFTIERMGEEGKFFGFGVCQKLKLNLIDPHLALNLNTNQYLYCSLKGNMGYSGSFPHFKISEINRDENTGELSITAYDKLYAATAHTASELNLEAPYTILDVANKCAELLGIDVGVELIGIEEEFSPFDIEYPTGANFDGAENLREVLNAIAEATQTVYYINYFGYLVFKRPDVNGAAILEISKSDYFTLKSKTNYILSDICSSTELGDNIITSSGMPGVTQYVRDNPFWELREDITTLLDNALAAIGGMALNQFDCSWRGHPALEIGDKIALVTKDDNTVLSYVFNDTIEYVGGLKQKTEWNYVENENETVDNPVTLGAALKQTYAKVDKANKQVEIMVSDVEANSQEISALGLTTDSITASVSKLDTDISELASEVNTKMTAEDVSILIQSAMGTGVESVTTSTGFTFNEEGLHISKSDSEVNTSITEDGVTVRRKNKEVLIADNLGVKAEDLHATTFLIIGNNSRLEDYEGNRTGCFWIGR